MNSEAELEVERVLRQWRAEPLTVVQAAQIAMKWAYEDAAKICDAKRPDGLIDPQECANEIRERGK